MIHVALADDHQIVLDGLKSILEYETDIKLVGTATNDVMLFGILKENKVDVVILDIEIPKTNGIETAKQIKSDYPEVNVIMLTMYKSSHFVNKALEAGAKGYLLKERGQEDLITAIKKVQDGQTFIGDDVLQLLLQGIRSAENRTALPRSSITFTKREKEVLALVVQGFSAKEIGKRLFIAPTTVISHKEHLFTKAGVKNVKELIAYAYQNGLA